MAIEYPRSDILSYFGIEDFNFDLEVYKELTRPYAGRVRSKNLAWPTWRLVATTGPMDRLTTTTFEARLRTLLSEDETFWGWDIRRENPANDPRGTRNWDNLSILDIANTNNQIRLTGGPGGFIGQEGDYISIGLGGGRRMLVQAAENFVFSGGGTTGVFEVRPHLRPSVNPGDQCYLQRARARMQVESFESAYRGNLRWSVTLNAFEAP